MIRRGTLAVLGIAWIAAMARAEPARIPVIDITDLYHPHQDPGDNVDLVAAYALPEIDLRAVIFDISAPFRQPVTDLPEYGGKDAGGPREPGFIPVQQLNYLSGRNVPCACAPFARMASEEDTMPGVSGFESAGITLLLDTLRASEQPVEIVSFGSLRPLAVAFNRDPNLLKAKVKRVHVCAGASSTAYVEWNVLLDRHAFARVLRSGLPIALYPCATENGPFALGPNNCYWSMPNLEFIAHVEPGLQRYLIYALTRSQRIDYLRTMDEGPAPEALASVVTRKHAVWETAVWIEVSGRKLVKRADGACRIIPAGEVQAADTVLPGALRPCTVDVRDDGMFTFAFTDGPTNVTIYDRGDPQMNEKALQDALPRLYESFRLHR